MFKELTHSTNSPTECLTILEKHQITHFNEYLLFNFTNKEELFFQNLDFLKAPNIWEKSELTSYTLVAQTIDNDYILATDSQVLVIPTSLNKQDSETFDLTIWEFLIAFEEKNLTTHILALN